MPSLIERLRFDADRDGVSTDVHHNLLDAATALEQARELLAERVFTHKWFEDCKAWLRLIDGDKQYVVLDPGRPIPPHGSGP